jgi:hypothetical protein
MRDDLQLVDVPTLIADYAPRDVFNTDETGLFFNVLPPKTFAFKDETCSGGKLSKNRRTVLMIANSDGSEKIGKAQTFGVSYMHKSLRTKYAANKKAWMTSKLFEKQILSLDALMGAEKRICILFLDRCPAHPTNLTLRNIKLAFPPKTVPVNCSHWTWESNITTAKIWYKYYYQKLKQEKIPSILRNMF